METLDTWTNKKLTKELLGKYAGRLQALSDIEL